MTADSDAEAAEKVAPYKKWFAELYYRKQFKPFATTAEAVKERLSETEADSLQRSGRMRFVGETGRVLDDLAKMKKQYAVDEIMIVSIAESVDDRINTVKQIAKAIAA